MAFEAVRVVGRIRPENQPPDDGVLVTQDEQTVILLPKRCDSGDPMASKRAREALAKGFMLDRVFGPDSSQLDLFTAAQPLALSVITGYNATVFAYGHTGSGKTHTMMGTASDPGIIPRTIGAIFQSINNITASQSQTIFLVRMSYVELYNNQFKNLLDRGPGGSSSDLSGRAEDSTTARSSGGFNTPFKPERIEVRENKVEGVHLSGPSNLRAPVTSSESVLRLIAAGNRLRSVGATNCNEHSSRSHAVLTLYVESRSEVAEQSSVSNTPEVRVGKLHLVDLAGSERVSLSGAEGGTLVETQNINLSLSALGDVLSALSRNAQQASASSSGGGSGAASDDGSGNGSGGGSNPVPYRNSKLTYLLKDSLGGNSKTLMVATLRSSHEYHAQSLMTLMYATRAKRIRNFTAVNRDTNGGSGIHQVAEEIDALRQRLLQRTEEFDRLRDLHSSDAQENQVLRQRLTEIGADNETEKKEMETKVAQIIHNQAGAMAVQRRQVMDLQTRLTEELANWQHKCAEQKVEIAGLRHMVTALEQVRSDHGATQEEMTQMRSVLEAWQAQATSAQQELLVVSDKLRTVAEERSAERRQVAEERKTMGRAVASAEAAMVQALGDSEALRSELVETHQASRHERKLRGEVEEKHAALAEKLAGLEVEAKAAASLAATERQERVSIVQRAATDQAAAIAAMREEASLAEKRSTLEQTGLRQENDSARRKLESLEIEHSALLKELHRFQSSLIAVQEAAKEVVEEKSSAIERGEQKAAKVSTWCFLEFEIHGLALLSTV